ncbi:MAG: HK97-gp10 family putative phage morphogenesis protein [Candidatus Paceibacterota bacterium]
MTIRIKTSGFRELSEALKRLPDRVAVKILNKVGERVLQPIRDSAFNAAPVESGALKKSIKISKRLSARQRAQHKKDGPNDVEIFVGAGPLPAAHLQEFGTSRHVAQPFMRPAWDANKGQMLEDIRRELWLLIK